MNFHAILLAEWFKPQSVIRFGIEKSDIHDSTPCNISIELLPYREQIIHLFHMRFNPGQNIIVYNITVLLVKDFMTHVRVKL